MTSSFTSLSCFRLKTFYKALVTTRRTCKCVLSACKNAGKILRFVRASTDSVRNVEHAESTQTARSIFIACRTFSACGLLTLRLSLALRTTHLARACSCVLHLARACCARDKCVVRAYSALACGTHVHVLSKYVLRTCTHVVRTDFCKILKFEPTNINFRFHFQVQNAA